MMKIPAPRQLLLTHAFATAAMSGVIWQVQLLTYPQFLRVGANEFPAYHQAHTEGISLLVGPLMLAELALAIAASWQLRKDKHLPLLVANALLLLGIWLCTVLWQVPLHEELATARSEPLIRELIASNWLRTLLWTARSLLLFRWLSAIHSQTDKGA
ncbi:MAG: hypothetical protein EAZ65_06415 [Verrucomicrobia bacterium]|nr:MAG: hypothetical protein EAZ84_12350 [Verrucomicrobiota bacterium]TAE87647.1 MAG: hypothetical protein EAZ82_06720 [Verrucomicrobiota bacterium]TAF25418.1 MAG: hypothetical protein EAZ71_08025 [Verrucomicrobiota bacterium]TAF41205.1 MAG: hypothetical protein EAZ65_06415 [Verrucomicrobiota bacterium]